MFLRGRGVFFKAIALHSGISVQSARDIYAAHLAGETVSARMAAGERMWDIENDLVDTEWDEFAPLDMMRFA